MNGELFRLAVQGLKWRRRSSLLLFLVLFLSFAFAIVSLNITGSIQATNEEFLRDTYGVWYAAIPAGLESDEKWLQEQAWLDGLGVCRSYGEIEIGGSSTGTSTGSGSSIGTMDQAFLEMGRIGLQNGRFPESAGEIAVEADLLSALGADYTLGQELTVSIAVPAAAEIELESGVGRKSAAVSVPVERTFRLVGILREYSDLWVRSPNRGQLPLNSAMILPEDAESLRQSAQEKIPELLEMGAEEGLWCALELEEAVPQYHLTILPGEEEAAREDLGAYLASGDRGKGGAAAAGQALCLNTVVYSSPEGTGERDSTFYAGVILAMTVLAVICIYAVRLQDEARQLATFRSIGVTRRQLCWMLLYETLLLGIPALALGTAGGAAGTWAVLRLAVYSGSAPVRVVLPGRLLGTAAGLWLVSICAARLAVFGAALRTPLVGRFRIRQKQVRRNRVMRQGLTAVLACLFGTVVVYTAMESLGPQTMRAYWDSCPDYTISGTPESAGEDGFQEKLEQTAAVLREIPGVRCAWVFQELELELDFEGRENAELASAFQRTREGMTLDFSHPKGTLAVELFAAQWGDWEGTIDWKAVGADRERFEAGEAVLMSFPVSSDGEKFLLSGRQAENAWDSCGISAGDTIRLALASAGVEAQVEVGGIQRLTPSAPTGLLTAMASPYSVICSEAFLEKLEAQLPPGETFAQYYRPENSGGFQFSMLSREGPYGIGQVYAYADQTADFLSADAVAAEVCARQGLRLTNQREEYGAHTQEYLQRLILLYTGGGCAALVLALILWNSLAMEAEQQRRTCGILQAIGLSRRQLLGRQMGVSLLRGLLAAGMGWLSWIGTLAYGAALRHAEILQEYAAAPENRPNGVPEIWELFREDVLGAFAIHGSSALIPLLTAVLLAAVLLLSWLAQRRLYREDLMAKLREEH